MQVLEFVTAKRPPFQELLVSRSGIKFVKVCKQWMRRGHTHRRNERRRQIEETGRQMKKHVEMKVTNKISSLNALHYVWKKFPTHHIYRNCLFSSFCILDFCLFRFLLFLAAENRKPYKFLKIQNVIPEKCFHVPSFIFFESHYNIVFDIKVSIQINKLFGFHSPHK